MPIIAYRKGIIFLHIQANGHHCIVEVTHNSFLWHSTLACDFLTLSPLPTFASQLPLCGRMMPVLQATSEDNLCIFSTVLQATSEDNRCIFSTVLQDTNEDNLCIFSTVLQATSEDIIYVYFLLFCKLPVKTINAYFLLFCKLPVKTIYAYFLAGITPNDEN